MLIQIRKSQLISLLVPATASTQTNFRFPDQPQLRNARVDGIEVYNVNDMAADPSGNALITAAMMQKLYLTLFVNNADQPTGMSMGEFINQMPFVSLHRSISNQTATATPGVQDMFSFPQLLTDWSKSYVTASSSLGNGGTVAILLNVYYRIVSGKK